LKTCEEGFYNMDMGYFPPKSKPGFIFAPL